MTLVLASTLTRTTDTSTNYDDEKPEPETVEELEVIYVDHLDSSSDDSDEGDEEREERSCTLVSSEDERPSNWYKLVFLLDMTLITKKRQTEKRNKLFFQNRCPNHRSSN
jgi:hypothetical protein